MECNTKGNIIRMKFFFFGKESGNSYSVFQVTGSFSLSHHSQILFVRRVTSSLKFINSSVSPLWELLVRNKSFISYKIGFRLEMYCSNL